MRPRNPVHPIMSRRVSRIGVGARPIFPVKSITGRRGKMEELAPSFLLAIGAGVLVTLVTSKRCELTPGIGIEGQALKKYNRLNEE